MCGMNIIISTGIINHKQFNETNLGNAMNELNKEDILSKAFHNAWAILVQDPSQKEIPTIFESQSMRLYFVEIYKQLYAKSGGDKEFMIHWFNVQNKAFNNTPLNACRTEKGVLTVKKYFESNR